MRPRIELSVAVVVAVAFLSSAASLSAAEACYPTTPELDKALDAVHAARDGSAVESARCIDAWLTRTTLVLASEAKWPYQWLHVAVDLGGELARLGRNDEARQLLSRVVELDPKGEWGVKAATRIRRLEGKS